MTQKTKEKVLKELGNVGGEDYLSRAIDLTLKEVGKELKSLINDKRKIAERNLSVVSDVDGKNITLFVYLGLLEDSIKIKLGIK